MVGTQTVIRPWGVFFDEPGGGEGAGGEGAGGEGAGGGTVFKGDGGAGTPPKLPEGAFMAADFKAALPEDLRGHTSMAKITDLEGMARSFVSAQQLIGKDPARTVELPGADADFKATRDVLSRLGLPEEVSGYKLELPKGTPTWLGLDTDFGKLMLQTAHEFGVLPQQMQGLYSKFAEALGATEKAQVEALAAQDEKNITDLRSELGDKAFDEKVAAADFAVEKLGGQPLRDAINEAGLGTSRHFILAMAQTGQMLAEDSGDGDGDGGRGFGQHPSKEEALAAGKGLLAQAINETNPAERRRLNEEAQKHFARVKGGNAQ